jgi:hypothetical protein
MAKKQRPRANARMRQRALRKLARDREKLAALAPGGAADRPIEVSTPSVIDGRARSTPCPLCEGELELLEVAAVTTSAGRRREARVRCRQCHVGRSIWFAIGPTVN